MAEFEVAVLKEALHNQNLAMEKLYAELEEERKAAASGADEALAMILRLQAEKATERMEALQFRRIAEEKIQHDEDSLAFLKGVIFHQEMEINSLKCQIHACKHMLLSICVKDPCAQVELSDHPWLSTSSIFFDKGGFNNASRRNISLPAIRLGELCSEIGSVNAICLTGDEFTKKACMNGNKNKPKRSISDLAEISRRDREWLKSNVHYQVPSSVARNNSCLVAKSDVSVHPASVQDKFEVPESHEDHAPTKSNRTVSHEIISEEENVISAPCSTPQEEKMYILRDQDKSKKRPNCTDYKRNLSLPRKDILPTSYLCENDHKNGIAALENNVECIKGSVQNLENEITRMRENDLSRGNEQMLLLMEIREKLDAIKCHIQQQKQQNQEQQHLQCGKSSTSQQIRDNVEDRNLKRNFSQNELLMTYFIEAMISISL